MKGNNRPGYVIVSNDDTTAFDARDIQDGYKHSQHSLFQYTLFCTIIK